MSASCGATTQLLRYIKTVVTPRSELYIWDSNASTVKSGCLSQKLFVSSGLCRKVDYRSKESSIFVSMSTGSRIETAEDDADRLTYKDAGVDIDAGSELLRRIAKMAPGIGGFGGLFPRGDPYLVAGTDGVGTKLKLAFESGIHETIGIDLTAEMPDLYAHGEYDRSGSAVGIVKKDSVIDGKNIVVGDALIGLPSWSSFKWIFSS